MNWRQLLGLKQTEAVLAEELIESAAKSGDVGWVYDANDSSLKSDGRFINLANIYREYAQAGRLARPELLDKYRAILAPVNFSKVPELWTLAQTRIFPLLRSRYERLTFEIKGRTEPDKPVPPRAAKPFMSSLDVVVGYDHGQTVAQVTSATTTAWGLSSMNSSLVHEQTCARYHLPAGSQQAPPSGSWNRSAATPSLFYSYPRCLTRCRPKVPGTR